LVREELCWESTIPPLDRGKSRSSGNLAPRQTFTFCSFQDYQVHQQNSRVLKLFTWGLFVRRATCRRLSYSGWSVSPPPQSVPQRSRFPSISHSRFIFLTYPFPSPCRALEAVGVSDRLFSSFFLSPFFVSTIFSSTCTSLRLPTPG